MSYWVRGHYPDIISLSDPVGCATAEGGCATAAMSSAEGLALVTKSDADGATTLAVTFSTGTYLTMTPSGIVECPDGGFVVTLSDDDTSAVVLVVKLSSAGGMLWSKELSSPDAEFQDSFGNPTNPAVDASGDVYVAFTVAPAGSVWPAMAVKLSGSTGSVIWETSFITGHSSELWQVEGASVDGSHVFFSGTVQPSATTVFVASLSSADGAFEWGRKIDGVIGSGPTKISSANGSIYMGTTQYLHRLSQADGSILAQRQFAVGKKINPVAHATGAFVTSKDATGGRVYSVDAALEDVWQTRFNGGGSLIEAGAVAAIGVDASGVSFLLKHADYVWCVRLPLGGGIPFAYGTYAGLYNLTYASSTEAAGELAATTSAASGSPIALTYTIASAGASVDSAYDYVDDIAAIAQPNELAAVLPSATGYLTHNYIIGLLPRIATSFATEVSGLSGDVAGDMPALASALNGLVGSSGSIAKTLPKIVLSDFGGGIQLLGDVVTQLPRMVCESGAVVGAVGQVAAELPVVAVAISGGVQSSAMDLPAVTASLFGVAGAIGAADGSLAALTGEISGVVSTSGTVAPDLPMATAELNAIQGNVADVDAILRGIFSGLVGDIGVRADISAVAPPLVGALHGSAAVLATLATRLPPLRSANFTTVWIQAHHLTHVMNTITTSVTTFDNYEYNSFAKFGGRYLAAGPSGLHIVDLGDKDLAANINAAFKTGQIDFGSPQLKRMSDFYVAMRSAGDISIKVSTDENDAYEYLVEPFGVETLKQRRVLIGKGMRGRYWQFELSNVGGGDFDFDAYSALVADTSRRV